MLSAALLVTIALYFLHEQDPISNAFGFVLLAIGALLFGLTLKDRVFRFTRTTEKNPLIQKLNTQIKNKRLVDAIAALLASIGMHMALTDGQASPAEISAIKFSITADFLKNVNHKLNAKIFQLTRNHLTNADQETIYHSLTTIIDGLQKLLARHTGDLSPESKERFFHLPFQILRNTATAQNKNSVAQEALFQRICTHYQITKEKQDAIKQNAAQNTSNPELKKRLKLFQLTDRATPAELERAWKKIVRQYHPDKYHGAQADTYAAVNQRFIEFRNAYDYLKEYMQNPYSEV